MVIQHNMTALNTKRQLKISRKKVSDSQEKLSSGYRINRSADDAAGLSISEKMRRQIRGLDQTLDNIQDGVSLIQVADGALTETHDILQRMNELAVKSANGTNSSSDRRMIQEEVDGLISEIDRIAYTTQIFNVKPLLGDTTVIKTSYFMPENTLHTLKDAKVIDGRGTIRFWAESMSYPFGSDTTFISVNDANGNSTGNISLTGNGAFITYTDEPEANKFTTKYNNGKISFQIELTWEEIDCSTDETSRQYYEYSYKFVNTSNSNLTFDFMIKSDMLYGPKSGAIPYLDGIKTENTYKWTGGSLPKELTIDDYVNNTGDSIAVNLSAQYVWKGIQNPPNVLMTGHTSLINIDNAMNPAISGDLGYQADKDYFYGLGWRQMSVGAGSQFVMQSRIGLYAEKRAEHSYHVFEGNPPVWIQTGCDAGVGMMIELCNATAENLGVDDLDLSTQDLSRKSIKTIGTAIDKVSAFRSRYGAQQNRLEYAFRVNDNTMENTQAAESIIRDTDMAEMISKYHLVNIVMQAGQSMLAQANLSTERVLQLLK